MIWRAILLVFGVPVAVVAGICLLWLVFASPVLLLAGHVGWMPRDRAIDFATLPALFLATCAALETVLRLVVSRLDDEIRTGGFITFWWRYWWSRLGRNRP
ncbi:hypothetical protein [Methylobacterium oxalidis]|uniref:Uncharacterized protein n=1 Tax=Methylobacterium oxalidis TaxID=944322 RepID=A0A512J0R9_9HYPH|nr:hypothetical protein [Methylobacterium oxalidis]GEP03525.1 hypothetical protein MOX02_15630 [Methylobacterium oxalidis]GJE30108.1 hypothetical protein LDDCCGHA_0271 [Methylobacterium oxalidis]GLS66555.1 hypothetical protein GCM10007888_49380 [Methylobacterium oxalidis]